MSLIYKCDIDGCDFKSKYKASVKKHKANIHNIDVIWYFCDNCEYKSKSSSHLKRHKRNKHGMLVIWHWCDIKGCRFKCKEAHNILQHKIYTHDIDVQWFKCDIDDCIMKFKSKSHLQRHMSHLHCINVKWYCCTNCDYKCRSGTELKRHNAYKHGLCITWHKCHIYNCESKFKTNCDLKRHIRNVHGISTKWFPCTYDKCTSKFKSNSHLKRHKEQVHDIGTHKCDFCLGNRNSHILYKDKQGKHTICRKCYNKATGKTSRVEHKWSDYLDKHIGTEYLNCSDKSLISQGGCSLKRPDKLYIGIDTVFVLECDENQHKWNSDSYGCEEGRISEIYDEDGIFGKTLVVIRWNPDHYKVPNGYKKILREERLQLNVKLKKYLRLNPPKDKITIYYMFYDIDSNRICKNYPFKMIYNEDDINKLNFSN